MFTRDGKQRIFGVSFFLSSTFQVFLFPKPCLSLRFDLVELLLHQSMAQIIGIGVILTIGEKLDLDIFPDVVICHGLLSF